MDSHYRKHPVHGVKIISGEPKIVFVTVCTKDRTPWMACPEVHELLCDVLRNATAWKAGRYVLMPDHMHFFAGYVESDFTLEQWMKYWKSDFSRRFGCPDCRWQTDHWDSRVRSATAYEEKWNYMLENPVRRGLVARVDDWPYRGEIYPLRWE